MRSQTMGYVLSCALVPATAWVLRRAERDYEAQGRLSPQASATGWALYALHAGLTLAAARHVGRPLPMVKASAVAMGGALALLGSWFFVWGVREFSTFEQMSGVETGHLVKSGPYRYSRNPQVVGWGLALLGAALAGRSREALLLVAAFFAVHRPYLAAEERHLERAFGEEYRRYRANVPRFLGLPRGPGGGPR